MTACDLFWRDLVYTTAGCQLDYGVFAGYMGPSGTGNQSVKQLLFGTEVFSTTLATLSTIYSASAATNSDIKGYWALGTPATAVTQGLVFSTITALALSTILSIARSYPSGVNSTTRGYYGGGQLPSTSMTGVIDGIQFSTESAITTSAILVVYRAYAAGINSTTRGYFGGGLAGALQNEIDGIRFDTEAAINPSATLTTTRYGVLAANSTTKGYFAGGGDTPLRTNIDAFTFATELNSAIAAVLSVATMRVGAFNSDIKGYLPTQSGSSKMDNITFGTETITTASSTLFNTLGQDFSSCQSGGIL